MARIEYEYRRVTCAERSIHVSEECHPVVLVFVAAMEESPQELKTALLLLVLLPLLMLTGLARSSITPSFGSGIN